MMLGKMQFGIHPKIYSHFSFGEMRPCADPTSRYAQSAGFILGGGDERSTTLDVKVPSHIWK
jgi:hypothetical protein